MDLLIIDDFGSRPSPMRAQAAIDRFTSNAYDLVIEGESYRARLKPGHKPEKKGK